MNWPLTIKEVDMPNKTIHDCPHILNAMIKHKVSPNQFMITISHTRAPNDRGLFQLCMGDAELYKDYTSLYESKELDSEYDKLIIEEIKLYEKIAKERGIKSPMKFASIILNSDIGTLASMYWDPEYFFSGFYDLVSDSKKTLP
jgi:hypothetical protein